MARKRWDGINQIPFAIRLKLDGPGLGHSFSMQFGSWPGTDAGGSSHRHGPIRAHGSSLDVSGRGAGSLCFSPSWLSLLFFGPGKSWLTSSFEVGARKSPHIRCAPDKMYGHGLNMGFLNSQKAAGEGNRGPTRIFFLTNCTISVRGTCSVVQSQLSKPLDFPRFWSTFRKGPNRLNFYL